MEESMKTVLWWVVVVGSLAFDLATVGMIFLLAWGVK